MRSVLICFPHRHWSLSVSPPSPVHSTASPFTYLGSESGSVDGFVVDSCTQEKSLYQLEYGWRIQEHCNAEVTFSQAHKVPSLQHYLALTTLMYQKPRPVSPKYAQRMKATTDWRKKYSTSTVLDTLRQLRLCRSKDRLSIRIGFIFSEAEEPFKEIHDGYADAASCLFFR